MQYRTKLFGGRRVIPALLLIILLGIGSSVYGVQFSTTKYRVYFGDANNNNGLSVYFHAIPLMDLLHGDSITPIVVPAQQSFIMELDHNGDYKNPQSYHLTEAQIENRGLDYGVLTETYDWQEFDGDGVYDAFITPANGLPAFVLKGTNSSALPEILSQTDNSEALSRSFEVWTKFLAAMRQNDSEKAASYFGSGSKQRYATVFSTLGDELSSIAKSFRNLKLVMSGSGFAIYAVNRTYDHTEHLFFVTIRKQSDGSWKVETL